MWVCRCTIAVTCTFHFVYGKDHIAFFAGWGLQKLTTFAMKHAGVVRKYARTCWVKVWLLLHTCVVEYLGEVLKMALVLKLVGWKTINTDSARSIFIYSKTPLLRPLKGL